jgi:hypothetical protein
LHRSGHNSRRYRPRPRQAAQARRQRIQACRLPDRHRVALQRERIVGGRSRPSRTPSTLSWICSCSRGCRASRSSAKVSAIEVVSCPANRKIRPRRRCAGRPLPRRCPGRGRSGAAKGGCHPVRRLPHDGRSIGRPRRTAPAVPGGRGHSLGLATPAAGPWVTSRAGRPGGHRGKGGAHNVAGGVDVVSEDCASDPRAA